MLPVTLRRSIAASGLALGLVVLPVAVPLAGAQTVPPVQRSCGSLGPPLCDLIDQFEIAIAPLEPLFALGIPIVSDLGNGIHALQATLEQVVGDPEAVDLQDAIAQLRGVFGLVGSITGPLLAPLGLSDLGPLSSVLSQLDAALQSQLAGASAAETVAAASVPATSPGSVVLPSSALAAGRTGPSTVSIPEVPQGAPLELPDLVLPDLGATVAEAFDLGSAGAALPDLPTPDGPDSLDTTNDAAAAAEAIAVSGVLVTGALLAARTQARRRQLVD